MPLLAVKSRGQGRFTAPRRLRTVEVLHCFMIVDLVRLRRRILIVASLPMRLETVCLPELALDLGVVLSVQVGYPRVGQTHALTLALAHLLLLAPVELELITANAEVFCLRNVGVDCGMHPFCNETVHSLVVT